MIDLKAFRHAVDTAQDQISTIRGDFKALYSHVGLPIGNAFTVSAVSEKLYELIRGSFASGHRAARAHCKALRRELVLSNVLDGGALDPYMSVVECLFDALGRPATAGKAEDPTEWSKAIQHAFNHARLQPLGHSDEIRHRLYRKDYAVAESAQRLVGRGYALKRELGNAFLEADSETKLVAFLEKSIAQLGGISVAQTIFTYLAPAYDATQERYHFVRQPSLPTPQLPLGYLLQLAAKYPARVSELDDPESLWREVLAQSTEYAALYEVQPYSQFELMFKDAQTLVPFLQELAIHDILFLIPQVRASDIIKIARGLLPDLSRTFGSGYSLDQVLQVAAAILKAGKGFHGPKAITLESTIGACPGIAPRTIKAILLDVFVHPSPGANQRFSKPTDAPDQRLPRKQRRGPDFAERPLLAENDKSFWMLDTTMSAPAFLEAVFTLVRDSDGSRFDDMIGVATEQFLMREFAERGIKTVYGSYYGAAGRVDGECDLVVEMSDTVVFIELKKKSLTRLARAGTDAALVIDLGASLLEAQLQAGAHELRLRRDGYLDLEDKSGSKSRITLGSRHIERIAVSLMDFGSFQDRTLLDQFLRATMGVQYSTADASLKKKFLDLNGFLTELRTQTDALIAIRPTKKGQSPPFFNCWFLSVPQLLVLLDNVTDADSFKGALWKTRHVVTGSLDFYHDYAAMLKLPAPAKKAASSP